MIHLAKKSLKDIVRIPLDIDSGRLDVAPNDLNEVYVIKDHDFHYEVIPSYPDLSLFRDISFNVQFVRGPFCLYGSAFSEGIMSYVTKTSQDKGKVLWK